MTTSTLDQVTTDDKAMKAAAHRAAFVQALRDCAAFLEEHPDVPVPVVTALNVFLNTRDELGPVARAATWEKEYLEQWFYLRRRFGANLTLEINAPREAVCRRVVVGKQTIAARPAREVDLVEWVCEDASLLRE